MNRKESEREREWSIRNIRWFDSCHHIFKLVGLVCLLLLLLLLLAINTCWLCAILHKSISFPLVSSIQFWMGILNDYLDSLILFLLYDFLCWLLVLSNFMQLFCSSFFLVFDDYDMWLYFVLYELCYKRKMAKPKMRFFFVWNMDNKTRAHTSTHQIV